MQPIPHRPASSHREPKRTSFSRTHPGYPAHFQDQQNIPRLKKLGYHSLEEDSEESLTSNEAPPHSNVVTPPYYTLDWISPPYSISNGDSDATHPRAPDEEPGQLPCTSSSAAAIANMSRYFSGRPTIFPAEDFDPAKDAAKICKAMKYSDIDSMSIISVLSKRSNEQRVAISEKYVELNEKEIECSLTRSGYGNFEALVVLSLESLQDTIAFSLNEYIKGLDTDENILIQGIVPYPNSFMQEVVKSYRKQFNGDVVIDLFRHKRGDFRTILMALLQGTRDENETANMEEMCEDADVLYKASVIPLSPNSEIFRRILTQRSFSQIKQIAQCYQKKYGISLEQCINNGRFGGYNDTLIALLRYATDKNDLLAEWFHRSIQETTTDDWALMQLTLGRSEIDLQDVKDAYYKKYGKPLTKAIASATSGEYKRFLMAVFGCQ